MHLRLCVLPQLIFCYSTYEFEPPTYGKEDYPAWAVSVGWALAAVSILQVPLWGLGVLIYYFGKGVSPGRLSNDPVFFSWETLK